MAHLLEEEKELFSPSYDIKRTFIIKKYVKSVNHATRPGPGIIIIIISQPAAFSRPRKTLLVHFFKGPPFYVVYFSYNVIVASSKRGKIKKERRSFFIFSVAKGVFFKGLRSTAAGG